VNAGVIEGRGENVVGAGGIEGRGDNVVCVGVSVAIILWKPRFPKSTEMYVFKCIINF